MGTADTTYLQDGTTYAQSHCLATSNPQDAEQEKSDLTFNLQRHTSITSASITDMPRCVILHACQKPS